MSRSRVCSLLLRLCRAGGQLRQLHSQLAATNPSFAGIARRVGPLAPPSLLLAVALTARADVFASAKWNDSGSLKRLLAAQPELANARHEYGWTPLHVAVMNGNYAAASELITAGADVNAADEFTNIFDMARKRRVRLAEVMASFSEEFTDRIHNHSNAVTFSGCTPLHYAVFVDDARLAELLLEAGADPLLENEMGHSALAYAKSSQMRRLLEDVSARVEAKAAEVERRRLPLEQRLRRAIVGQEAAINTVAAAIRRKETGWADEDKPLVFLFLGSSGVGKTELAKQLSSYLKRKKFIRLDMSEYQEKHEVAKLIGSPPGYVGHEEGGQLTSQLKDCPNAVVLFDEVEKAHPDVLTALLQLFDEGRLTDGRGNTVECKQAVFVMTSNLAAEEIGDYGARLRAAESTLVDKHFKENVVRPILKRNLKRDEFLGRINEIVYFLPFSRSELLRLVTRELETWALRADQRHGITLKWDENVVDTLAVGYNRHYGARSLKHEVDRRLISLMAAAHDQKLIARGATVRVVAAAQSPGLALGSDVPMSDQPDSALKLQIVSKDWKGSDVYTDVLLDEKVAAGDS